MNQSLFKLDTAKGSRIFNESRGFTLIEILVSLVIISLTMTVLATLLAASMRGGQNSRHTTAAVTLMQDKIEEFKNTSYASITSGSETAIDSEGNSGGQYDRSWTVTTSGTTKEIVVTINWPYNGVTKTKSLTTLISE